MKDNSPSCSCNEIGCCGMTDFQFRSIANNASEIHNLALMEPTKDPAWPNLSDQQLYDIGMAYFDNISVPPINYSKLITFEAWAKVMAEERLLDPDNPTAYSDWIYGKGIITLAQKSIFDMFNRIVVEAKDMPPEYLIPRILLLEDSIIQRSDLTLCDKQIYYQMITIAKYSARFWLDAKLDPNNPWHQVIDDGNLPKWLRKLLRDVFVFFAISVTFLQPEVGLVLGYLASVA
jgi:hypothetical protein